MHPFTGDARHIGPSDSLKTLLVTIDEVLGISEILVIEHAAESLGLRVEGEHQAVQSRLPRGLQLIGGDFARTDLLNLLLDGLECIGGGSGLSAAADLEEAGMIVVGAPPRRDLVSQP